MRRSAHTRRMRTALRYFLTIVLGLAIGVAAAVHRVRAGAFASDVTIGPWRTGRDFGTATASARTRAVVALSGLLALPAHEARYYTAATDDTGQPLDGRCRYRVSGGALPARWWSLTLYDPDGYLVGPGPYSVESAAALPAAPERWRASRLVPLRPRGWAVSVGRAATGPRSLRSGNIVNFQLTLRLYLPADGGRGDPPRAVLPSIAKEGC